MKRSSVSVVLILVLSLATALAFRLQDLPLRGPLNYLAVVGFWAIVVLSGGWLWQRLRQEKTTVACVLFLALGFALQIFGNWPR